MKLKSLMPLVIGTLLFIGCQADSLVGVDQTQGTSEATASKGAVQTAIAMEWDSNVILAPGEQTISGQVLHVRNASYTGPVTGDLTGTITTQIDYTVVLPNGNGEGHGNFIFEVTELFGEPVTGTFEGRFSGPFDVPVFRGQLHAEGTGDLEGMRLTAGFTDEAVNDVFVFDGRIIGR
jgi:hypothetical protein